MSDGSGSRQRTPIVALLVANTISLIGEAMTLIAIPWFVYEATGSATRLGIVGFFTVLPRVLSTFFGGTIVDRIGFKRASIVADLLSGLAMAAIPLAYATIGLSFPLLLALVFLGAFFDGPGVTARESLVPELVTHAGFSLERVNGVYQMVRRLSEFVGPAIVGVAIVAVGTTNILWINALSFAFSILIIGLLVPGQLRDTEPQTKSPYWRHLREGFAFIRADPLLRALAIIVAILNFMDAPLVSVLLPVLTRETWDAPEATGLLLSAFGGGAVAGALLYAAIGHRLPRGRTFATSFLLAGLPLWVLSLAPPLWIAMFAMVVSGLAAGPLNPILMTIRQERVPTAIRARVFGIMTSIAFVAIPLGHLLGGIGVELIGVRGVLAVIASVYLVVTAGIFFTPLVRALERKPLATG